MSRKHNASSRRILLATAILLLNCSCTRDEAPPPAPPSGAKPAVAEAPPVNPESLSLLDFKFDKNEAGKTVLRGSISNSSPQKITLATATFKLLDKNGGEIGTATALVDDLEPTSTWIFRVEILQEGVASAQFAGFTVK